MSTCHCHPRKFQPDFRVYPSVGPGRFFWWGVGTRSLATVSQNCWKPQFEDSGALWTPELCACRSGVRWLMWCEYFWPRRWAAQFISGTWTHFLPALVAVTSAPALPRPTNSSQSSVAQGNAQTLLSLEWMSSFKWSTRRDSSENETWRKISPQGLLHDRLCQIFLFLKNSESDKGLSADPAPTCQVIDTISPGYLCYDQAEHLHEPSSFIHDCRTL